MFLEAYHLVPGAGGAMQNCCTVRPVYGTEVRMVPSASSRAVSCIPICIATAAQLDRVHADLSVRLAAAAAAAAAAICWCNCYYYYCEEKEEHALDTNKPCSNAAAASVPLGPDERQRHDCCFSNILPANEPAAGTAHVVEAAVFHSAAAAVAAATCCAVVALVGKGQSWHGVFAVSFIVYGGDDILSPGYPRSF
jgi:hypothetical protein